MIQYGSEAEVEAIVSQFLQKTLPVSEWTHEAHLTVGLWFVSQFGEAEAVRRMSGSIYAYNEAVGTPNTDSRGYHETLTRFWLWVLSVHWEQVGGRLSLSEACNQLFVSPLADRTAFLKFYSRELIFSVAARRGFVAPDLLPWQADVLLAG